MAREHIPLEPMTSLIFNPSIEWFTDTRLSSRSGNHRTRPKFCPWRTPTMECKCSQASRRRRSNCESKCGCPLNFESRVVDTVRGPDAQWRFLKSVCLTLLSFDRLYQIAFRCRSLVAVAVSSLFTGVHVLANCVSKAEERWRSTVYPKTL